MALSDAAKAGFSIFIGALVFTFGMVVSEIYYSAYGIGGYSVSANVISDLGANCPDSGSCYIPPSSLIFDTSIAILGLAVLIGAYFLHRAFRWKPGTGFVILTGIGLIGIGTFNETTGLWHGFFSLIVFLSSGLTAVLLARFQRAPMNYLSVILGVMTLVALVMYVGGYYLGLGAGGMERMVVYPVLLWTLGFGGYLMSTEHESR